MLHLLVWLAAESFAGAGVHRCGPLQARVVQMQENVITVPLIRVISSKTMLPPSTVAAFEELGSSEGLRVIELTLAPPVDAPPPELGAIKQFTWIHVATAFSELAAAKQLGAVTVWLNAQAATTSGDLGTTGYLGAAIMDDFADRVCGTFDELPAAMLEAQLAAVEKEELEERRFRREHEMVMAEAERNRPVRWDAEAAEVEGDALSPFGVPAIAPPSAPPPWVQTATPPPSPLPSPPPSPPIDEERQSSSGATSNQEGTAKATKFCIACGSKLPAVARFCSACGEPQVEP